VAGATEYQFKVLVGLLHSSSKEFFKSRIDRAVRLLTEDYFVTRFKVLFAFTKKFYFLTLEQPTFDNMWSQVTFDFKEDESFMYKVIWDKIQEAKPVSCAEFKLSVALLKDKFRSEKLLDGLVSAAEILKGDNEKGENRYFSARKELTEKLAELDAVDIVEVAEGDLTEEGKFVLKEYADSKKSSGMGVLTGVSSLDGLTGGLKRGELMLVAGFTGDCKTTFCINLAYNAVFKQKKNVVYATGETLRQQIRRRVISLHSTDPKFGLAKGISYTDIKKGILDSSQEKVLVSILDDMKEGDYGRFMVLQFPHKASVDYIRNQLSRYTGDFDIDLVIIDELRLLNSGRKRQAKWEELDDLIVATKQLAVTHDNGKGVPIVSPYQVSRKAWEEIITSKGSKGYRKTCLANSSEAERSADIVMSILKVDKGDSIPTEAKCSVLKYRDGRELSNFFLRMQLDCCKIWEKATTSYRAKKASEENVFESY